MKCVCCFCKKNPDSVIIFLFTFLHQFGRARLFWSGKRIPCGVFATNGCVQDKTRISSTSMGPNPIWNEVLFMPVSEPNFIKFIHVFIHSGQPDPKTAHGMFRLNYETISKSLDPMKPSWISMYGAHRRGVRIVNSKVAFDMNNGYIAPPAFLGRLLVGIICEEEAQLTKRIVPRQKMSDRAIDRAKPKDEDEELTFVLQMDLYEAANCLNGLFWVRVNCGDQFRLFFFVLTNIHRTVECLACEFRRND